MEEKQKKILIVDDEPSIVKLASVKLKNEGFEVEEAYNGKEALEKVAKSKPDLIILDIMMPIMDGKEVRKALRQSEETKKIPVIILTALGEFEEQLKSLGEEGVTEYLTKPFDPKELTNMAKMILGGEKDEELEKLKHKKEAKLRTIVDIMHRKQGES